MNGQPVIAVYGAYGHTGSLVVRELLRRGFPVRALGRDAARLQALSREVDVRWRVADMASDEVLDAALDGCAAVVLCAGPFGATAGPVLDAAIRQRIDYFDTCAEPDVVQSLFDSRSAAAEAAGIVAVPCLGFFGAIADWTAHSMSSARASGEVESIHVAYALDEWIPTRGSSGAAAALSGRRWVVDGGVLKPRQGQPPMGEHHFGGTFGRQRVLSEYPGPEVVLLHRRAAAPSIRSSMSLAGLRRFTAKASELPASAELRNGAFRVELCLRSVSGQSSAASASGNDLYAASAPIVGHAVQAVLSRPGGPRGLLTPAQAVPAASALTALSAAGLSIEISAPCGAVSADVPLPADVQRSVGIRSACAGS